MTDTRAGRVTIEAVRAAFNEQFERPPAVIVSAPGRANLIGEHTDYNGGFVLPFAIDRRIWVAGALTGAGASDTGRIHAANKQERVKYDLADLTPSQSWADYPLGVIAQLAAQASAQPAPLDLYICADLPESAGLSSSAALCVATAATVAHAWQLDLEPIDLARVAHRAENEFVGVRSGIMDQFASALGGDGHALFLDCKTEEYRLVPVNLPGHTFLLADTGVRRELAAGQYNERRAECEEAAQRLGAPLLRDVTDATALTRLPSQLKKRARHVIFENARVLLCMAALEDGDARKVGALMTESHKSLRDDYAVSCPELDCLVSAALDTPGVFGARMMGAGFGGWALVLVEDSAVAQCRDAVTTAYATAFDREVAFLEVSPGPGVQVEWTAG